MSKKPTVNINIHNLVGAVHITDKGVQTGDLHKKITEIFAILLRDASKAAYIIGTIKSKEEILLELDKIADKLNTLVYLAKEIDMDIQVDLSKSILKNRKIKFSLALDRTPNS